MLALDESALMAGVARLDPLSLAETHDRYYPEVLRFVLSKVGHRETAEDITSEVFVRLLRAVQACRGPDRTLRGWLLCVACHIVNDNFRRHYALRTDMELSDFVATDEEAPVDQVIHKETLVALHGAIEELTSDQQKVIRLRYGYGMSIRDVAAEIGKSEGAVKQLQARAVAALAKEMA
jgi:RNA polymerase sigma-70 factor (ECF subfamily)